MAASITEQQIRLGNMETTIRAYKKLSKAFHEPLFKAFIKKADANLDFLTDSPLANTEVQAAQQKHWSEYKAVHEQLINTMDTQINNLFSFNHETKDTRPPMDSAEIKHWIDRRAEMLRGKIQAYSKEVLDLAGKYDPEHKKEMMQHPAMKTYLEGTAEQLFELSVKMWKDTKLWDEGKAIIDKLS